MRSKRLLVSLILLGATGARADAEWKRALDAYLFPPRAASGELSEVRTDSALVLENGRVIYERHREPAAKRHILWSVSKSVTSALVGVAVKEGKLAVTDSICKFFPELVAPGAAPPPANPRCRITVDHVLQWGSGLGWSEEYENAKNPVDSSVIQMLYGDGLRDAVRFVLAQPVEGEPGRQWRYSSGDSELLQGVLRRAYGGAAYRDLPRQKLFGPLGMDATLWEADPAGNFGGASYVYAPARDLSRLGELYLADGVWQGRRLLPEGWVKYSTTVADAFATGTRKDHDKSSWVPGRHWWVNREVAGFRAERPWPSAPLDTYAALGHWGQNLIVIPSRHLVIVRLGDDRKPGYHIDELLKHVLAPQAAETSFASTERMDGAGGESVSEMRRRWARRGWLR
jgi:CubicO group peptidase (beta-lactamase class C family)